MAEPHPDDSIDDVSDLLYGPPRVFGADLAASHGDGARWDRFYKRRFPDCEVIHGENNAMLQGIGADVILQRPTGKQILVEEKVRASAFGDCLIEIWSKFFGEGDARNRAGWSVHPDKHPDWLAYAVRPIGRCWFVPFAPYRLLAIDVVSRNPHWRWSRTVGVNGQRWQTAHTSVAWDEVYAALHLSPADVCFEW